MTAVANRKKSKDWSTEWRDRAVKAPCTKRGSALGRSFSPHSCQANSSGDQGALLAGRAVRIVEIIVASNAVVVVSAFLLGCILLSPVLSF